MYRVEICDNERDYALRLERILKAKLNQAVINVISEEHLQAEIKGDMMRPDILYVSVKLRTESGVSQAVRLQRIDPMIQVIFLAHSQDDVTNIFEAKPTGFLLKPFEKEKIYITLKRAVQNLETESAKCVQLKNREHLIRVRYQDICYIESDRRYLFIHKKGGTDRVRMKLSEIETLLPDYFVRCHQSYIINIHELVATIDLWVTLADSTTIPISRSRYRKKAAELLLTLQGFPFSKAISGKWKHSRERTSRQGSRTGIRNTKTQFNHSVRCMENRKDFMHLFTLGKGDLWNRQKSRQRTKNSVRISKRKSEEPPTTWQFISAKQARKP